MDSNKPIITTAGGKPKTILIRRLMIIGSVVLAATVIISGMVYRAHDRQMMQSVYQALREGSKPEGMSDAQFEKYLERLTDQKEQAKTTEDNATTATEDTTVYTGGVTVKSDENGNQIITRDWGRSSAGAGSKEQS